MGASPQFADPKWTEAIATNQISQRRVPLVRIISSQICYGARELYQLEVKLALVRLSFPPAGGWKVHVAVDPMELGKGPQHKPDKAERAAIALSGLRDLGAQIDPHPLFGPVDVVADHQEHGLRLIEVEGQSSRQQEQALYSALGQIVLSMKFEAKHVRFGLAVPSTPQWIRQARKIPTNITKLLTLDLYLVDGNSVTCVWAGESIPNWSRGA